VQLFRWFERGRGTEPDCGILTRCQGPNGLPPVTLMAHPKHTGVQLGEAL
jgi:hypothetical protein